MAKLSATAFAEFIWQRMAAKDGYIFGARGQDPKKWAKTSWWFTQYKGSQRTKALYWREHAARVWDCQGLAEGYINDVTGKNIDVRARDNFANWCDPKGKGKIPAERRVPGAAVFMGWPITHVGFLVKPVNDSDPTGDWWVVEARGVMYGVVKTRLSARSWTRWGLMTKYFDYAAPVESDADSVLATGDVNIRAQPNTRGEILGVLKKGGQLPYAGETSDGGWFKVDYDGKQGWVSGKYARLAVAGPDADPPETVQPDAPKLVVDLSHYNRTVYWGKAFQRMRAAHPARQRRDKPGYQIRPVRGQGARVRNPRRGRTPFKGHERGGRARPCAVLRRARGGNRPAFLRVGRGVRLE